MSSHVCKVCKKSSNEVSSFILCTGHCKQYLHYFCAKIEDRFRSESQRVKYIKNWECDDCNPQGGQKLPKTKDLYSENNSGNSLSPDIGSVEDGLDRRNGNLPNTVNELNALRAELSKTVESLEHLRNEYHQTALKISDIEQKLTVKATSLEKVSVGLRDTNKSVSTFCQNVGHTLEIHGLVLRVIISNDLKEFVYKIKRKIVEVGYCFGVEFSVDDIDKVDILKTKKNLQQPILIVHFFSKHVRDTFLASRKKRVINSDLQGGSYETRIYINENLCSYYKSLWFDARQLARKKRIQFVWVRDGKLYVRKDSQSRKIRIICKEDLDKLEAD